MTSSKLISLSILNREKSNRVEIAIFRSISNQNRSSVGLPRVPGPGTRVINYPGNFLLPAATRVPEQKQITANVLNISAIFKQNLRNPNIDLSDITRQ